MKACMARRGGAMAAAIGLIAMVGMAGTAHADPEPPPVGGEDVWGVNRDGWSIRIVNKSGWPAHWSASSNVDQHPGDINIGDTGTVKGTHSAFGGPANLDFILRMGEPGYHDEVHFYIRSTGASDNHVQKSCEVNSGHVMGCKVDNASFFAQQTITLTYT